MLLMLLALFCGNSSASLLGRHGLLDFSHHQPRRNLAAGGMCQPWVQAGPIEPAVSGECTESVCVRHKRVRWLIHQFFLSFHNCAGIHKQSCEGSAVG